MTLLALRNSIAILMASLGVAILGLVALGRLPVDLFPNINLPIINVGTIYTGAGVLDIEKTVTYPIEKAVSAVSDVKFVESKSRRGLSTVRLWMNWGADVNNGQTEVIQRIQQILNSLPTGIKQPFIVRFDLSNIPVALVTVAGGGLDERQLYDLAYNTIEPQLERLGGVASASVDGGKVRQITVNLNRDQLFAKGVSIVDVVSAVNSANFLLPAGDMKAGRLDYNLYTNNQFAIVPPMENIVVGKTGAGGVPIHVKDLGYVADSHETQTSIVRIDDTRGVFLSVNKQPGANTIAVVDQVKKLLPKLLGVPPGVKVGITFDQSIYIRRAIESLWDEAIQGSVLAFVVILVFLRSLTSTLIISIAIPLSILLSFICMYFLGQTLNVFTLGGLALAVGRLVDDSIVELENINRHLNIPGTPRRTAVLDAAREVAMPIFSDHHDDHRLRADGVPRGSDQTALHPAHVHDLDLALCLLPRLAHRDATPGPEADHAREAGRPRVPVVAGPSVPRLSVLLHVDRGALCAIDRVGARAPAPGGGLHRGRVRGQPLPRVRALPRSRAAHRHGVLPGVGRGAVPHQPQGAGGHAGRGDGTDRQGDGVDRQGGAAGRGASLDRLERRHPARAVGGLHQQHRPAQRQCAGRPFDRGRAQAERPGDHRRAQAPLRREVSRHDVSLRPWRPGGPDHQLRVRHGARGLGPRLRPRRGGRPLARARPHHGVHERRHRRDDQPRRELPTVRDHGRPREGGGRGPLPARDRGGRPLLAELQREHQPVDLHRPADGQPVQCRRPARRAVPADAGGSGADLRDDGRRAPRPPVHDRGHQAVGGSGGDRAEVPAASRPHRGQRRGPRPRLDLGGARGEVRSAPTAGRLHGPPRGPDRAAARVLREPLLHLPPRGPARVHGARVSVPLAQGSVHDHVLRAHGAHRRLLGALPHEHDPLGDVVHGHHHDGRHRRLQRRAPREYINERRRHGE